MSGSKTTHAKFRVSVLVTSVVVGVASLAQLPARPTSAAAATLSGSKGPGPSESSGRIPALPAASSVAARVAPLVMAPGVFDTATAKPRVFPALVALPVGVVGEVSDRRTLRDEKATTVQLGAAVGDVALPGEDAPRVRGGLTEKGDGSQERGGDPGGDREGSGSPRVRVAGVSGRGAVGGDDDVLVEVGEIGSRVRVGAPLGGGRNVKASTAKGRSTFSGGGPSGGDVILEATSAGVKESVVLRSVPAGDGAFVVRYPLLLDPGLTPELAAKGSPYSGVVVKDGSGGVVWVLPDGDAIDSASDPQVDGGAGRVGAIGVPVGLVKDERGAWLVTVTVDGAWLRAKERVFPVTIDPTIVVGQLATDLPWAGNGVGAITQSSTGQMVLFSALTGKQFGLWKPDLSAVLGGRTITYPMYLKSSSV